MAKKSTPLAEASRYIIALPTATGREDKGMTLNYRVVEAAPNQAQVSLKTERGETVIKNTIMGGNGTIYIARALSDQFDTWVLMPMSLYHKLLETVPGHPMSVSTKKGKK